MKKMDLYSLLVLFTVTLRCVNAGVFRQPRLSLAEESPNYYFRSYDGYSNTYMFGYDNNDQYRNEERLPNGTVVGSYGYIDSNGKPVRYNYIADEKGYRVMKDRMKQNQNQNQQNNNMQMPNQYQGNNNMYQNQYQQSNNMYQNQPSYINQNQYQPSLAQNYQNLPKATTEDSITWTRPQRQKNRYYNQDGYSRNVLNRRITYQSRSLEGTPSYVPMIQRA